MNTPLEAPSAEAALAHGYAPAPSVRVGILRVGAALSAPESEQAVDAALIAAGHTPLRRRATLQPRPGETELRVADVITFLTLYGHEYALAAFRLWPAAQGHEAALVAAAAQAGCRTLWETETATPDAAFGCDILLRRTPA